MREGDYVEDFELIDQDGQLVKLADLVEEGPLVFFFYPKAMTTN
jgi:peroxiredoxin Q/BCP